MTGSPDGACGAASRGCAAADDDAESTIIQAPVSRDSSRASTLAVAGLALVWAVAIQALCVEVVHDDDLTGPFLVGEERTADWDWPLDVATLPGHGYDGQFFLLLALEPFPSPETARHLDLPAYRGRRILWPLLAHVTGLGSAPLILLALYLWNALFVGLGAAALAEWLRDDGVWRGWALLYAASPGVVVSCWRMLGDPALVACLLWTFVSLRRERPYRTGGWLLAALLAKETALLVLVGATVLAVVRRDRRLLGVLSAVVLGVAAWWLWVSLQLPGGYGSVNVGPPLVGLIDSVPLWFQPSQSLPWALATLAAAAILVIAAATAIAASWRWTRAPGAVPAIGVSLLLFALLASVLSRAVWVEAWAFTRALLPLPPLLVLGATATGGGRRPSLLWFPFVSSGLLGAALVLVLTLGRSL